MIRTVIAGVALATALSASAGTTPWSLPAPDNAAQPQLIDTPEGDLLLSWLERRDAGGHRMRFARFDTMGKWSPPRTVAEGSHWFVNWADVPAMVALADGSLWAHTLEKSGDGTYAYDVMLQRSGDGGVSWSAPTRAHDDGTATEHGFVSLWPAAKDRVGVAWLDGRATGGGHDGHDGHGDGRMSLRSAVFDATLDRQHEWPLDLSTCDCCQTDVALGREGPILVYRDRTDEEIRDIYLTRQVGTGWTAPVRVHRDDWHMPACPVNGPAVAARGNDVWVAWPTEAGGASSLRIAHSRDGGRSFSPMQVAAGTDSLGRVDLAVDAAGVWLLWMTETDGVQSLWLAQYRHGLGEPVGRERVADVSGRGRGTGFPRLQLRDGTAYIVWTEIVAGQPRLRGTVHSR